jgi:hypothetical protein
VFPAFSSLVKCFDIAYTYRYGHSLYLLFSLPLCSAQALPCLAFSLIFPTLFYTPFRFLLHVLIYPNGDMAMCMATVWKVRRLCLPAHAFRSDQLPGYYHSQTACRPTLSGNNPDSTGQQQPPSSRQSEVVQNTSTRCPTAKVQTGRLSVSTAGPRSLPGCLRSLRETVSRVHHVASWRRRTIVRL